MATKNWILTGLAGGIGSLLILLACDAAFPDDPWLRRVAFGVVFGALLAWLVMRQGAAARRAHG
ncbi:MAG: hypothetical protein ACREID_03805 [Planctomycetota bacterium]